MCYRATPKVKQQIQDYNSKYRIRYAKNRKLKRYKITEEQYDNELVKLDGRCPLCKLIPQETFHIDHCHITGLFRGLLCGTCNKALGMFKEDIPTMKRAIEYLEKHNKCVV